MLDPLTRLERGCQKKAAFPQPYTNFFTNDMPEPIAHTDYILYADDITLIVINLCIYATTDV